MSAGNVSWEGEIDAAGVKADTFSSVKLQPKRLTAYVDISKQLLNQDSIGVENTIRQDLVKAINAKLEATILGDGDGKEGGLVVVAPEGLFKGVNVHGASTVWSATTMAKIAEVESALDGKESSADYKYIVNPKAKAALRSAAKGSNVSESLYSNNEIDGTPALCSAYVPENLFAFGDFSNVVIGQWGAVDIVVDTVTQATKGCVRLVVNAYFDAKVLRSGSFSFGSVSTEPAE
jgi:HK97 family phage major capsid protein